MKYNDFLLTGATGFLGNTIAWNLHERWCRCRALVSPGSRYTAKLPPDTAICGGNVLDTESMEEFSGGKSGETCLIHCAGKVSVASKPDSDVFRTNVAGTANALKLAAKHGIGRIIYVSSVHAIPERPEGLTISETRTFLTENVRGDYAKSKAAASRLAMEAASRGMNLSIVHPSGIIGPGDWRRGQITSTIAAYCNGKLPADLKGGNNFVVVRDVAGGILACADGGAAGECYILSGHTATVRDILEQVREIIGGRKISYLPLKLVKMIAPIWEMIAVSRGEKPFLTPYSAYALGTNADYSHDKATKAFGYMPRRLEDTVRDTVMWMKETGMICVK